MTIRKFLKIFTALIVLLIIAFVILSYQSPVLSGLIYKRTRVIGKPINATAYTDGQPNKAIDIYHVSKYWDGTPANYYLVHFKYADTKEGTSIICIDLRNKFVGRPSSTNKRDYDVLFGKLFQSEVGSKFSLFTDDIKGYGFDPELSFSDTSIQLKLPPAATELKYSTLKILL